MMPQEEKFHVGRAKDHGNEGGHSINPAWLPALPVDFLHVVV